MSLQTTILNNLNATRKEVAQHPESKATQETYEAILDALQKAAKAHTPPLAEVTDELGQKTLITLIKSRYDAIDFIGVEREKRAATLKDSDLATMDEAIAEHSREIAMISTYVEDKNKLHRPDDVHLENLADGEITMQNANGKRFMTPVMDACKAAYPLLNGKKLGDIVKAKLEALQGAGKK